MDIQKPVQLRDDVMIVPGEDGLQILHPKHRMLLEGEAARRIHLQVGEYLDGTHTGGEILNSVPAEHRNHVRRYLRELHQADALAVPQQGMVSTEEAPTATALKPYHPVDLGLDEGTWVRAVEFSPVTNANVWFMGARRPQDVMVHLDALVEKYYPLAIALLPSRPSEGVTRKTKSYLLYVAEAIVTGVLPGASALYRVDPVDTTSEGVIRLSDPDAEQMSLAGELSLVGPSESIPQLPLVCMEATHELLSLRVRRVGIEPSYVAGRARDALLRQVALRGSTAEEIRAEDTIFQSADAQPASAHLRVLNEAARSRVRVPASGAQRCDLLQEPPSNEHAAYLVETLRDELNTQPAFYACTDRGLHVYSVRQTIICSVDKVRARVKALALAVAQKALPMAHPRRHVAIHPEIGSLNSAKSRVSRLTSQVGLPSPKTRSTQVWGRTLHVATLTVDW